MALSELHYTKNWTNKEDFPTHESNEAQVRADIQLLFDEIQMAFNKLLSDLKASEVPFTSTEDVQANNVQDAIENVQQQVAGLLLDELVVPDGSITQDKLAPESVGRYQLEDGSVTGPKVYPRAIGVSQIALQGVDTENLADGCVTDDKLGANVPTSKADLYDGVLAQTQFRLRPKTLALAGSYNLDGTSMASIIRVLALSTNDKTYVVAPVGSSILNGSFVFITSERNDGNTVVRVQSSSNGAVTTTDYPLNKGETAILIKVLDTKWVFSRLG